MRPYALPLIAGLVLGGLVHIVTTLTMPRLASEDAFARLARLGPPNVVQMVPDPTPTQTVLPRMDPSFLSAVCVYDLSSSALRLRVPTTEDYTSISFYTRYGLAYYALNDHAAGARTIELQVMTAAQRAALPEDEDITAADRLIVESPTAEGTIMIRALVRDRGNREAIRARLTEANCSPIG
ncbi:MAG TPA: DUF1254 domain-containing protein [Xanthobacteraceae bacterium]|nr:DUF1254 domain-containing protein [Xanthobacteraceae bacterium]